MNQIEAKQAFEKLIMTRWTDWKPTAQQQADWVLTLQPFTYDETKTAVFDYVQNYQTFAEPKLHQILKSLRKLSAQRPKAKAEQSRPYLLYEIRSGGRSLKFYANIKRNIDETALLSEAEEYKVQCGLLYGGEWAIVRHWDSLKSESCGDEPHF